MSRYSVQTSWKTFERITWRGPRVQLPVEPFGRVSRANKFSATKMKVNSKFLRQLSVATCSEQTLKWKSNGKQLFSIVIFTGLRRRLETILTMLYLKLPCAVDSMRIFIQNKNVRSRYTKAQINSNEFSWSIIWINRKECNKRILKDGYCGTLIIILWILCIWQ